MAILHACSAELNSDGDRRCIAIGGAAAMAVTIFEDLVLRERGDTLLDASVSSERWWSRKATRGDNADTSVCEAIHARSNSQIFFLYLFWAKFSSKCLGNA